jgi:hypothetical protein
LTEGCEPFRLISIFLIPLVDFVPDRSLIGHG